MSDIEKNFMLHWGWRISIITMGVIALTLALVFRIYQLTAAQPEWLQKKGNIIVKAHSTNYSRGNILDRRNVILATSVLTKTLAIDTNVFHPSSSNIDLLASLIGMQSDRIQSRINGRFGTVFIKRQLPQQEIDALQELSLSGIKLISEYKRYYPLGESAAALIGLVDIDGNPQEGVEVSLNHRLKTIEEILVYPVARNGKVIGRPVVSNQGARGNDVKISIDANIQRMAYDELVLGIQKSKAIAGSVVVIEVATGEILAAVSYPTYNPNNRANLVVQRNRVFTDLLEPGSTIKPFTVASSMLQNGYSVQHKVDTSPGYIELDNGKKFADLSNLGVLTLESILVKSSQVGIAKLALDLSFQDHLQFLNDLGFGQRTFSGFPNETGGILPFFQSMTQTGRATIGFGHGIGVSILQLAKAYTILARNGSYVPVTLNYIEPNNQVVSNRQIIDAGISQSIKDILHQATEIGTGKRARIKGLSIAGKTGTSHFVGKNGYEENHYRALFAGMLPYRSPKFVLVVNIEQPDPNRYYGGQVAAPVFSSIGKKIFNYYRLPSDTDTLTNNAFANHDSVDSNLTPKVLSLPESALIVRSVR